MDNSNLLEDLSDGEPITETTINPNGFFADNNDKVAVRVRPFIGRELRPGRSNEKIIHADETKLQIGEKEFGFDRVFDQDSSQDDVFETCARNLILGCFEGYNATILAYGQTGSGKTFTMGTSTTVGLSVDQIGIVPRVFDFIFQQLELKKRQNPNSEFTLKVQFLELYGDEIHDLLDLGPIDKITGQSLKQVTIHEEKNGTIRVDGLKSEFVQSRQECIALLNKGIAVRVTSSTLMNEGSSRSHAIFTIVIEQKIVKTLDQEPGQEGGPVQSEEYISAKFHFVDLAGSERIKKTGASGKQLQEGISINKGLLMLGNVISALTDDKKIAAGKQFIPYRDSKLTRILQDSLGGNSRTTMIACVSPADSNHEESLSTIKYASRARNIKNKPIVNRDANSMLIESLRSQIVKMGLEIIEYQKLLKENGIKAPATMTVEQAVSKQSDEKVNEMRKTRIIEEQLLTGSSGEIRELKIRLARKEKELKEALSQIGDIKSKSATSASDQSSLQSERDDLVLKLEQMSELLQKNNISVPTQAKETMVGGKRIQTLVDEYKAKLAKFQTELDKKNGELLAKSKKIAEMQTQIKRDEQILKKTFEENQRMKKQGVVVAGSPSKRKNKPEEVPDAEKIKDLFMDKLTSQLSNFIGSDISEITLEDETSLSFSAFSEPSTPPKKQQLKEALETVQAKANIEEASKAVSLEEKEKLLQAVRQSAQAIKQDLGQLLKNTWASQIHEIEVSMQKAKQERNKGIAAAGGSQDKSKEIEKEYVAKMEALNKQLQEQQRERKKKEDSVTKTMVQQEQRLKAMENEITKMKKEREELEKQKKYGEERFSKFKSTVSKDLLQTKKTAEDKAKALNKLKFDLKKTDQLVQQKMSELRGLQKKVRDEKERRQHEEEKENNAQGFDVDTIKDWITQSTEQLLKQQELQQLLNMQLAGREEIEEEMFAEGDRLTELSIQQERLQFEQQQLLAARDAGEEYDEARDLEIEVELEDIATESNSITATLTSLEEHMEFITEKINSLREEISSFDVDSIQPPRFKGIASVETARKTLRTFFTVLLELNVYKRDIEAKCIEQDEKIIDLQSQLAVLAANSRGVDRVALMRKQKAVTTLVSKMGVEFIDNRETADMELTTEEQNQLTKLSLSKIVNNLRVKLQEEQTRVQSLNLKLDAAYKEKEQLKQKFLNYQRQRRGMGQPSSSFIATFGPTPTKPQSKQKPRAPQVQAQAKLDVPRQENQSPTKRLSFKQRRDLQKEQQQNQKQDGKVESSLKKARIKRQKLKAQKSNETLADQLSKLEEDLKKSSQPPMSAEERQARKLAYMLGQASSPNKDVDESGKPVSSFLHAPSQPETVQELAEEDDVSSVESKEDEKMIEFSQNLNGTLNTKTSFSSFSDSLLEQLVADDKPKLQQWTLHHLTGLPIESTQSVLALDSIHDRLFVLYDDLTLIEVSLTTKEIVREQNIADIETAAHLAGQRATAFAMLKDLNMIAVATDECVVLLDYEVDLNVVTSFNVANVVQICFLELYIVLLAETENGSQVTLSCFQIDSDVAESELTINQFLGQRILMRQGQDAVYYAAGKMLGKISVPELELEFQEDAGHQIMDLAVSDTCIFTTGNDAAIRVFDCESGMELIEPMAEMECDALAMVGYHLVARCGGGQAIFVFKYENGMEELEEDNFIECDDSFREIIEDPTGNGRNFCMRGGFYENANGVEYNGVILANLTEQGLSVNILKAKAY